jgi:hypothetical protein
MRMGGARGERGQVLPLIALIMVVAGLAVVAIGKMGGAAVDRAQAATAADAAALAGAAEGKDAARALAEANGGRLAGYEEVGDDARVRVEVGDAVAPARARREGGGGEPWSGAGIRRGVAPAMAAALVRAGQLLGGPVPVVEVVAPGLEVRVAAGFAERLAALGAGAGLCQPAPADPMRFGLCPWR